MNLLSRIKNLRRNHLKAYHNLELYPYQEEASDLILEAFIRNQEIIRTSKRIEELDIDKVAMEFSRQSGKTTAIVHTVEVILIYLTQLYARPFRIGIFAPQREQASTDFERLRLALSKVSELQIIPEKENAQTLRMPDGSECYIFPITKTSHSESKTFDLMIFEEAHNINDHIMQNDIWPMGSSTASPEIYIGTAGYHKCYFKKLLETSEQKKLIYDYKYICKQRREFYLRDKKPEHLFYEKSVNSAMETLGYDADEFKAPYRLIWILGVGQFITNEDFDKLIGDYDRAYNDKDNDIYVGIDTAKSPDSTVVTYLRWNHKKHRKEVINWLELRGDNYKDQFDIILDQFSKYTVRALAIDSTGQGDFMPDMFERETRWRDENSGLYRVKFSLPTKDILYKNLMVSLRELLTKLPKIATKEAERCKEQFLDLQKEYKGELLSCHHPDTKDAHDDYCASLALAEYAYAKDQEKGEPKIRIITTK